MEIFQTVARALHIAFGVAALITGLLAIIAPKGQKLHTRGGIVYVWSMTGVAITALLMSLMKPELMRFFVPLSFFTLQLTLSGWRALERKKLHFGTASPIARVDWGIAIVSLLSGITFTGFGGIRLWEGEQMGIVSIIFGVISIVFAMRDIRRFHVIQAGKVPQMEWFFAHMTLMLGAYIATITAVLVVNFTFLPHLAVWLGPTFVGTFIIRGWRMYYAKKFRLGTKNIPTTKAASKLLLQ